MRYDTPLTPAGAAISNLPVREQFRRGLKDMARSSYGSARNFGVVGAMFAGTECCIEGVCFVTFVTSALFFLCFQPD